MLASISTSISMLISISIFQPKIDAEVEFNNATSENIFETAMLKKITNYNDNSSSSNEEAATNMFGGPYDYEIDTQTITSSNPNLHKLSTTGTKGLNN